MGLKMREKWSSAQSTSRSTFFPKELCMYTVRLQHNMPAVLFTTCIVHIRCQKWCHLTMTGHMITLSVPSPNTSPKWQAHICCPKMLHEYGTEMFGSNGISC